MVRDGSLFVNVGVSLLRIAQGFGLAAAAALALGILVGLCPPLRLMLEPIVELLRPIPPLAFLPMFLVWFGLGETSKVAFIAYTTFFPMFVGIASSLLRVDVMLLRAAASLGATRAALLRHVVLPASLPGIVVALRVGFGLALFVIVGAEFMGADAGLGHMIMEGRVFFNPAQIVMGALLLGALGSRSMPCCWRRSGACSAVARRRDRRPHRKEWRHALPHALPSPSSPSPPALDARSPRASPRSPRSMPGSCGTRRCPRSSRWPTRWATSRTRASR